MRPGLITLVTTALMTAPALAGSSATVTPLGGSIGSPFDSGPAHGVRYDFGSGGPAGQGPPFNLYDNIPTFFGGTSTQGFCGPFGKPCHTFAFVDWDDSSAQWGDDLHGISAGGVGPAVVTALWYAYLNTVATTTHVIKIYDMVPPSIVPTVTSTIEKGALLASVVVPSQPFSTTGFVVTVTGLSVALPHSAVWIKFEETGSGFPGTSWLTGGYPGIGYSHPGLTRTVKYPGGGPYNEWLPLPYLYIPNPDGLPYVATNITLGLNGFHIPAPGTIAVLGLGGLLALRRKR